MTGALFGDAVTPAMDTAARTARFEQRLIPVMPALLSYFQRRVVPVEDAQDCVSETLVVLWRQQLRLPEDEDALRAYAFGVARRVLQNQRRGRIRRDLLDGALRDELDRGTAPAVGADDVDAMLGVLSDRDRELVTLVVLDGFSLTEAAAALGVRPGTARMRYSRARARLRRTLLT